MNTSQLIISAALQAQYRSERRQLQQLEERIKREQPEQERVMQEQVNALVKKIKSVLGFDVVVKPPLLLPPTLTCCAWSTSSTIKYELDDDLWLCLYGLNNLRIFSSSGTGKWSNSDITSLEDLGNILSKHITYQDKNKL